MTLEQRLSDYRAAHPVVELPHGGTTWRYRRAGKEGPGVLLLPGALGIGEFGFPVVSALEPSCRIIAPDYPPVATMAQMLDGLVAILDAEGVARAHVVGGSFGGIVAQALVRRVPQRVASLVLSHTGAPGTRRGRGWALALLAAFPGFVLRAALKRRLRGVLAGADPFWLRYFDQAVAGLSKADIVSRMRLAAEFGDAVYKPDDLAGWPGRVLVVESEDDPLFRSAQRQALRDLYPRAEVHTFTGTGHVAAVLQPENFADVLARFFRDHGAGSPEPARAAGTTN
jgi:pimeloyl-ACP methyl ester carboxylesterase